MVLKSSKPGPKKGVTRKPKRTLDSDFPDRLRAAMGQNPKWTVPTLARDTGCTRAVLGKYLNGHSKNIEALLLFDLANALNVSAEWLLTGRGMMAKSTTLSHDDERALNVMGMLQSEQIRDMWISQGEQLAHIQPPLLPSPLNPYRVGAPRTPMQTHEPPPDHKKPGGHQGHGAKKLAD